MIGGVFICFYVRVRLNSRTMIGGGVTFECVWLPLLLVARACVCLCDGGGGRGLLPWQPTAGDENSGPRPLHRFTPPPEGESEYEDDEYSGEEGEYTSEDGEEDEEDDEDLDDEAKEKYKDEILQMVSWKVNILLMFYNFSLSWFVDTFRSTGTLWYNFEVSTNSIEIKYNPYIITYNWSVHIFQLAYIFLMIERYRKPRDTLDGISIHNCRLWRHVSVLIG